MKQDTRSPFLEVIDSYVVFPTEIKHSQINQIIELKKVRALFFETLIWLFRVKTIDDGTCLPNGYDLPALGYLSF